jgi:glycyl-tRNA synthetase alpha chain
MLSRHFEDYERQCLALIDAELPLPAYDFVLKCSHAFNVLDARGALSVSARAAYVRRVRDLARKVAALYVKQESESAQPA